MLDKQIQEQAEKLYPYKEGTSKVYTDASRTIYIKHANHIAQWTQERENANWQALKEFLYEEIINRREYSASKSFEVVLEEMERLHPSPPKD